MSPRIFISYSTVDRAVACQVLAALRELGLEPWLDVREVKAGDSLVRAIDAGLSASRYVVLLLSPEALQSSWVAMEWEAAIATGVIVVPVVVRDVDIPPLLRRLKWVDMRRDPQSGLDELTNLFRREIEPAVGAAPIRSTAETLRDILGGLQRRQIRLVAMDCLDAAGLSAFCYDVRIRPDELVGMSVGHQVITLLHHVEREELGPLFIRWLSMERAPCIEKALSRRVVQDDWNLG